MSGFKEYERYDATGLAELVRKGETTPAELAQAAIERIERLNGTLNAVVAKAYDDPREAGRRAPREGPLAGVPFLVKDTLTASKGLPLSQGSRFWKGYVPARDSEAVARWKRAGLQVLGGTNTPELAMMAITEPKAFGPTRNPWSLDHSPGGSSGGAAAAVAAGMVPLAAATDGGGSIRVPASCCGLFGLKPTRGRVPLGPETGESWRGLTAVHAITRSVRDSAAALDAAAGPDAGAPYAVPPPARSFLESARTPPGRLRIAFTTAAPNGVPVHADCVRAVEETAKLLEGLGHEVEEAAPEYDAKKTFTAMGVLVVSAIHAEIEAGARVLGRRPKQGDLETPTWIFKLLGENCSAGALCEAQDLLHAAGRRFAAFMERRDAFLTPTLSAPPCRIGALQPKGAEAFSQELMARLRLGKVLMAANALSAIAEQVFAYIPFTPAANVAGTPAMSVPLHWNAEGLPVGVMLQGRWAEEGTLLSLAAQLEEARPWADRRPRLP